MRDDLPTSTEELRLVPKKFPSGTRTYRIPPRGLLFKDTGEGCFRLLHHKSDGSILPDRVRRRRWRRINPSQSRLSADRWSVQGGGDGLLLGQTDISQQGS